MTIEEYKKNLRGVNDNKDFTPEFLVSDWLTKQAEYSLNTGD